MSWVAAAVVGGGLASGVMGSSASRSAARQQTNAANAATVLQGQIYNQNQINQRPYMQAGTDATTRLADLLGTSGNSGAEGYGSLLHNFDMNDYLSNQDPGYEFMRGQGENALINRTSKSGSALGGQALKSLMNYNQEYAKTGFNDAFTRYQTQQGNIFQRLSTLATLGENAAAGVGAQGVQTGANIGANMIGAGNAAAAGTIGAANAWSNATSDIGGALALNSLTNGKLFGGT